MRDARNHSGIADIPVSYEVVIEREPRTSPAEHVCYANQRIRGDP